MARWGLFRHLGPRNVIVDQQINSDSQNADAKNMPFEDTHSLLEFLALAIGCVIFMRMVGREKHRREYLMEFGSTPGLKPIGTGKRQKNAASAADDDVVAIAQPVAPAGKIPAR
jgi:hypothetical protein